MPRAVAVLQRFNHRTHHRGRLTTLIRQAGRDPGQTDIPWPGVARFVDAPPERQADQGFLRFARGCAWS